jgi:hypothetical protein
MPRPSSRAATNDPAVDGLIRILASIGFDCPCRKQLDTALALYSKFSDLRRRKLVLSGARERALRISGLLDLLEDLDELPVSEPDHSAFNEMADLFRNAATAASEEETLLRSITSHVDHL